MVTIILAHPWHGSFNKAICDTVAAKLERDNRAYQVIDLYKDNFDPVISEDEIALYSQGKYLDPLVGKYQEMIGKTEELVIIFPNWWTNMPAILKGFFDKVMLKDFAFNYVNGWTPLLRIRKAVVITTSDQPTENVIKSGDFANYFIVNSLNGIGVKNSVWLNCERVSSPDDTERKNFLEEIKSHI